MLFFHYYATLALTTPTECFIRHRNLPLKHCFPTFNSNASGETTTTTTYIHSSSTAQATMSATLTYPPGGTFFDTINKSFTDVTVQADKDNAINTTEFLQAAESLTSLFGMDTVMKLCQHSNTLANL